MKGAGLMGFCMNADELPVLHDVFQVAVRQEPQKTTYEVQFLWRDLTSAYDMIGPYFPVPKSIDSNTLQEFIMLCLKAFTSYGFRVSIMLCDGASSNLCLLNILAGYPRAQLPYNENATTPYEWSKLEASFQNPEDVYGSPVFMMICPSHQVHFVIHQ